MARRIPGPAAESSVSDAQARRDYRWLITVHMASEPGSLARAKSERVLARAVEIERAGGSPARMLAELWRFLDEIGSREAGERLLGHLNRSSPAVRPEERP